MKCPCCEGYGTSNTCINGTFQPCTYCNGTGEVDKIVQKFKNPYTNFQRITANTEALATFVHEAESVYERCAKGDLNCNYCECQWCGLAGRKELIDWLNEES